MRSQLEESSNSSRGSSPDMLGESLLDPPHASRIPRCYQSPSRSGSPSRETPEHIICRPRHYSVSEIRMSTSTQSSDQSCKHVPPQVFLARPVHNHNAMAWTQTKYPTVATLQHAAHHQHSSNGTQPGTCQHVAPQQQQQQHGSVSSQYHSNRNNLQQSNGHHQRNYQEASSSNGHKQKPESGQQNGNGYSQHHQMTRNTTQPPGEQDVQHSLTRSTTVQLQSAEQHTKSKSEFEQAAPTKWSLCDKVNSSSSNGSPPVVGGSSKQLNHSAHENVENLRNFQMSISKPLKGFSLEQHNPLKLPCDTTNDQKAERCNLKLDLSGISKKWCGGAGDNCLLPPEEWSPRSRALLLQHIGGGGTKRKVDMWEESASKERRKDHQNRIVFNSAKKGTVSKLDNFNFS